LSMVVKDIGEPAPTGLLKWDGKIFNKIGRGAIADQLCHPRIILIKPPPPHE